MKKGKLILIVGLPGSGKGTLVAYARDQFPQIVFPISWTTRPIRPGEAEGANYHFATDEEFMRSVESGEFLEWVTIDGGHRYGTRKNEILPALEAGKFVMREIEVLGARAIMSLMPREDIVIICINPDSWEDLSKRMLSRAPMSAVELEERRKRYEREAPFKKEADFVIDNTYGELDKAKEQLSAVLRKVLA